MSAKQQKEYGLIIPKKHIGGAGVSTSTKKTTNVFGDDSDEDQSPVDWTKQTLKKQSLSSMQQKQSTLVMKKALQEDPNVYQYDELYDDMEKKRADIKEKAKKNTAAKYMPVLLQAAERRNREHEQRIERQVQKEREAEQGMYNDKDVFVTGAYRKKMEEAQRIQEEQDKKDALDDLTEVTKQKDMSGFYRHLYRQTMEEEDKLAAQNDKATKENSGSPTAETQTKEIESKSEKKNSRDRDLSPRRDSVERKESHRETHKTLEKQRRRSYSRSRSPRERSYRKSRDDSRYSGRAKEEVRTRHRSRSGDSRRRDRYFRRTPESNRHHRHRPSRSRSRSTDRMRNRNHRRRYGGHEQKEREMSPKRPTHRDTGTTEKDISPKLSTTNVVEKENVKGVSEEGNQDEEPPKSSIWTKRTVGTKFTDALARYFRRKQENYVAPCTVTAM